MERERENRLSANGVCDWDGQRPRVPNTAPTQSKIAVDIPSVSLSHNRNLLDQRARSPCRHTTETDRV
jgi:hypothetical protein